MQYVRFQLQTILWRHRIYAWMSACQSREERLTWMFQDKKREERELSEDRDIKWEIKERERRKDRNARNRKRREQRGERKRTEKRERFIFPSASTCYNHVKHQRLYYVYRSHHFIVSFFSCDGHVTHPPTKPYTSINLIILNFSQYTIQGAVIQHITRSLSTMKRSLHKIYIQSNSTNFFFQYAR